MGILILTLLIAAVMTALGAAIGRWTEAPHDGRRPALGWLALALLAFAITVMFCTGVTSI